MDSVLIIVLAVLAIFILLRILSKPIRFIFKMLLNALFGFVVLFILNFFGDVFGISVELNFLNALIVGVLGIPGVILVLLL